MNISDRKYKIKKIASSDDFIWASKSKSTFQLHKKRSKGMTIKYSNVMKILIWMNNFKVGIFIAVEVKHRQYKN